MPTREIDLGGRRFSFTLPETLEDPNYKSRDGGDEKPYWAFIWQSSLTMVQVISEGPDLTGKRVIEIGCGLGLASLAAALKGATVTASDIRPEAIQLLKKNAADNNIPLEARIVDIYEPPEDLGLFDGVIAADVLYHDGMLSGVLRFMRKHLKPDGLGALTDPYRIMPAGVLGAARLNGFDVQSFALGTGGTPVVLYSLTRRRR